MTTTVSPTQDAIYTKLRALVVFIVPALTEVVKGLDNRVPTPKGPHVQIKFILQSRLSTAVATYADPTPAPGSITLTQPMRVDAQFDFYGPASAEWAAMFTTWFRSEIGCEQLAPECQPLYADEARQIPTVTGEEQYLERWCVTASLQWNPATSTVQEFADTLSADLINVDVTYPPS